MILKKIEKILENQDESLKKGSGFILKNPICQKLTETIEGQNMFDLINEFLIFFKMDYTQSVFIKETNLSQNINRDKLIKNLALKENIDPDKPILMHIVIQYLKSMLGGMAGVFQVPNQKKNVDIEEKPKKKNEVQQEEKNNLFTKKKEPIVKIKFNVIFKI